MNQFYIIELSEAVWKCSGGRTLVLESAGQYTTKQGTRIALGMARRERPWRNSRIRFISRCPQL